MQVIVIGAGLGGLAAACTLAARGHRVRVLEASSWIGGKAAVLEERGYRFDMGPTILTVPAVLERLFAEAGRRVDEYLELRRLDPQWRCFFEDGSVLDLHENVARMSSELDAQLGTDVAAGYRDFVAMSAELHRISERFFFWRSVQGIADTFDLGNMLQPSTLRDVLALKMGQSVAGVIRSKVSDTRVAQMLDHFTQYVGSSPAASPAVLCGIASMQLGGGVWYPVGGTRAVPEALGRLAAELGVDIETDVRVERLLVADGEARGVVTSTGRTVHADAVVSNMDSVRTHRELMSRDDARRFLRRRRYEPACSGVVLYLGLDRAYQHLLHHNFIFSTDPEEEFDHIYQRGEPAPDPTCYVAAPARTDGAVAPPGGEALYVLVHTPYLRPGHDWRRMLPRYREQILYKLEHCGGMPDLRERIVVEHVLTPEDIRDRYRVLHGAIYGLASHGRFLGAFKPGNRSPDLRRFYLAGGSAHPGPGMPMALMSGWIAADALCVDAEARADRGAHAARA